MILPLRHKVTKTHKEFIIKDLHLVKLSRQIGTSCAFESW
jgi:hypothetical protein